MTAQDLKNSIRQMTVQGKLVPQQVSDGTAVELLKKIAAERTRLAQEGNIKTDKNPSVIDRCNGSFYEKKGKVEQCIDDELPFDIPGNWEWVRLRNILYELQKK
jgi:type I restriction enzyme, S subunit